MDNPLSMTESAVGMHEHMISFMQAGFTRAEAFELCRSMLMAAMTAAASGQ